MARTRDQILAEIEVDEAKIRALNSRAGLLGVDAWLTFRQGFIQDLNTIEAELLAAKDVPLSEHAQGIRKGKRQIILALLFTPEEVQQALHALQLHVQGLRQELSAWQDRSWSPEPGP